MPRNISGKRFAIFVTAMRDFWPSKNHRQKQYVDSSRWDPRKLTHISTDILPKISQAILVKIYC